MTPDEVCRELEEARRAVGGARYRLLRLSLNPDAHLVVPDGAQGLNDKLTEAWRMLIEMIQANRPAPKPVVMQIHTVQSRSTSRRKKQ